MDENEDSIRRDGSGTWSDHFESNLRKVAIRKAPLWNQGLIEGAWLIRINSARPQGQRISAAVDMDAHGLPSFGHCLTSFTFENRQSDPRGLAETIHVLLTLK